MFGSTCSAFGLWFCHAVLPCSNWPPQPLLACSIRLDITIPAGCSRIDIVGRYGGFGGFGRW